MTAGGTFDPAHAADLTARLRWAPAPPDPATEATEAGGGTLRRLPATCPWLAPYRSLRGVWRAVRRLGQRLRRGRPRQVSPDPASLAKEAQRRAVRRRVAAAAGRQAVVVADEFP